MGQVHQGRHAGRVCPPQGGGGDRLWRGGLLLGCCHGVHGGSRQDMQAGHPGGRGLPPHLHRYVMMLCCLALAACCSRLTPPAPPSSPFPPPSPSSPPFPPPFPARRIGMEVELSGEPTGFDNCTRSARHVYGLGTRPPPPPRTNTPLPPPCPRLPSQTTSTARPACCRPRRTR